MGEKSQSIHSFVIPLISYSTDPNAPDQIYMIEDGLELWQTTLQNASKSSPELVKLFPNILKIIKTGEWDYLINALRITEGYILLCKNDFMNVRLKQLLVNIL